MKNKMKLGVNSFFVILSIFSIVYVMTADKFMGDVNAATPEEEMVIEIGEASGADSFSGGESIKYTENPLIIDNFDNESLRNNIGCKTNVYVKAPSRIMSAQISDNVQGKQSGALMLRYDKQNEGGPYGMGGWCGYYTLLKNDKTGQYLDASDYNYISFWVKGEKGDENFMVGLADKHWEKVGDSLKSEEIITYLDTPTLTTEWQKVKLPLDIFFLNYKNLSALTVGFEPDCFPEGAGRGTIYIDDIALEK